MHKHVIALNAARQKRNTLGLLMQIQALLALQDIDLEIVNLHDVEMHDCLGCLHCLEKGGCVWKDGFQPLWERIEAADGLILASPVYVASYGATLKRWVDRAFIYVHRPVLTNKPVLAVSTGGGGFTGKVNRLMLSMAGMFGLHSGGAIGRIAPTMHKPVTARELQRFIGLVKADPATSSPTVGGVVMFQAAKFMSCYSPVDTAFWQARGWDQRLYPYERSLGWKRPIAWLFDRVLMPLAQRSFAKADVKTTN
jgi:multimeric flavodoxin WrbA